MTDLTLTLSPESIEAIAKRVDELAAERQSESTNGLGTAGLVSLDEVVSELPSSKKPETWKHWLYEQVRRPDAATAMGATKLGGNWFFDRNTIMEWLATRW